MHVALFAKSFAFAQAIVDTNNLMHLLTYLLACYYALAYYYIPFTFKANKGCVTLYGLAIYIKKLSNLKAKEEELWKLKYFTMQKYINLQRKNPLKETKILQDIIITLL